MLILFILEQWNYGDFYSPLYTFTHYLNVLKLAHSFVTSNFSILNHKSNKSSCKKLKEWRGIQHIKKKFLFFPILPLTVI